MTSDAIPMAQETLLLKQPTVSADHIAFLYASDIWIAGRDGRNPHRLTAHKGVKSTPMFSPDGEWIAFSANYDGNTSVYVIGKEGGSPRRLTFEWTGFEYSGDLYDNGEPEVIDVTRVHSAEIIELHHDQKRDAPSGTALGLARAIAAARGQDLAEVGRYARAGDVGARPTGEIGATSRSRPGASVRSSAAAIRSSARVAAAASSARPIRPLGPRMRTPVAPAVTTAVPADRARPRAARTARASPAPSAAAARARCGRAGGGRPCTAPGWPR